MGFNFSGMMRGLGAGAVAVGGMMERQAKLDWETQQMNLKYEREQHMADLQRKFAAEEAQKGRDVTVSEAQKTRDFQAGESKETRALTQQQIDQTKAYQDKSLSNQELQIKGEQAGRAATAEHQAQILKNQEAEIKLKTKVYEDQTEEGKYNARKKHAEELVLSGIPEKAVQIYVATGEMPKLDKETLPLTATDIEARRASADVRWADMTGTEKKQFMATNGAKSESEAQEKFRVSAIQDLFVETGRNAPGKGGGAGLTTAATVQNTPITEKDIETLRAKNPDAQKFWLNKLERVDPDRAKLLREKLKIVGNSEASTGAANTDMSGPVPTAPAQNVGMLRSARTELMRENPKSKYETDRAYTLRIDELMKKQ